MENSNKHRFRKEGILSVSLILAVNAIISGALIFIKDELGISLASAEFLLSLPSITTIIAILLSEPISQKIGIKKCVSLGLFLVGTSAFLPIFIRTYPSVFISRLILGFGVGLYNGHAASLINIFYKGDEAASLHGIRNSCEHIGLMLLLFIAGLIIKISWHYVFLTYTFAFLILIIFNLTVEDVVHPKTLAEEKFKITLQTIFFMVFAGVILMDTTAVTVRFSTIATANLGANANINMLTMIFPIFGMTTGFFFGKINRRLRSKTILLGLLLYIFKDLTLAIFGQNLYIYMICIALTAISQSLCFPYIFAEVARVTRSSSSRIVNNLIFVGSNIGGFLASSFLSIITLIFNIKSPTTAFMGFSVLYLGFFAVYFYEYLSVRSFRRI
ncbi:MFS transporter [Anaerococcus degeneri]|uniref:MFS transporter n=2 Tax=Anaerococcus TaxID=165779 RepID=A0ABS7YXT2_9FIRM|nr:MFS transporter [Anaerococcus degeneri]MBP2015523.1 MFS family permease [Anaerococcus degeneri]MCA2095879.1 MFS transporter [Anaerococcus degeneri]